jgi:hypothetical protein
MVTRAHRKPEEGVFYKNRPMLCRRAFRASWGILVRQAGVRQATKELRRALLDFAAWHNPHWLVARHWPEDARSG